MVSMSDLAMLISRFPTSIFFGTCNFSGSARSSAKCINSRTRAPSSGFTPARYWRVLITTFATPTLLVLQCVAEQRVCFVAAFLRLKVVRLIEEHWVDLFLIDEILNIYRLRRLEINPLKVLILQDNIFALLILIALHDLVPRNFLAVLFGDTLVIDRAQVALAQQTEPQFLASRSGIKSDGNVNQPEADAALPDCARHILSMIRAPSAPRVSRLINTSLQ